MEENDQSVKKQNMEDLDIQENSSSKLVSLKNLQENLQNNENDDKIRIDQLQDQIEEKDQQILLNASKFHEIVQKNRNYKLAIKFLQTRIDTYENISNQQQSNLFQKQNSEFLEKIQQFSCLYTKYLQEYKIQLGNLEKQTSKIEDNLSLAIISKNYNKLEECVQDINKSIKQINKQLFDEIGKSIINGIQQLQQQQNQQVKNLLEEQVKNHSKSKATFELCQQLILKQKIETQQVKLPKHDVNLPFFFVNI
ncbi:hypothetical protein PPERSA_06208 [Pseudocohnilembus persalinus]|uniref:Uncharacterized protein n=1 Tax=Pseudocohnilembus persalinus TaxID=266149 RepID=A0A0V0R0J3_PSEPJ|nr:hypothetical protein PPERSA_06208 [Pseudocohnilembus persalinus]|eukprot:KRX08030.1 hypothetical protein PPERSA_06208 [Pseudocohnilembus persalinus]